MSGESITSEDIEVLFNPKKFLARPFRGNEPRIVKRVCTCHFCGARLKKGEEYYHLGGGGSGASYLNFCIRCVRLERDQVERIEGEESRSRAIVYNPECNVAIFSRDKNGNDKFICVYKNARKAEGYVKRALTRDVDDVVAYLITNLDGQIVKEVKLSG